MTSPLERLRAVAQPVDATAAAGFVQADGLRVLVFVGDALRPEAQDVAVVALELLRQYPTLGVGVVDAADEAHARASLGVEAVPALLFARPGRARSTVARLQPWAVYARTAALVFGTRGHAVPAQEVSP